MESYMTQVSRHRGINHWNSWLAHLYQNGFPEALNASPGSVRAVGIRYIPLRWLGVTEFGEHPTSKPPGSQLEGSWKNVGFGSFYENFGLFWPINEVRLGLNLCKANGRGTGTLPLPPLAPGRFK